MRAYISLWLLLLTLMLTACDARPKYWSKENGTVIDYETNEPLKEVYIVALWEGGAGIVDYQSTCYHIKSVKSDSQGNFVIPSFNEWLSFNILHNKHVNYYPYKPGYIEYVESSLPYRDENNNVMLYMKKFTDNKDERFKYFKELIPALQCVNAGESSKNAYPLYEAMFNEAKMLADTEEHKKTVDWIRVIAAEAAVAPSVSDDVHETEEKIKLFLRDNLK